MGADNQSKPERERGRPARRWSLRRARTVQARGSRGVAFDAAWVEFGGNFGNERLGRSARGQAAEDAGTPRKASALQRLGRFLINFARAAEPAACLLVTGIRHQSVRSCAL